jgi:hypothetical protein
MEEERVDYLAYLLRMWRSPEEGSVNWRASLEEVNTHRKIGFASLDDLLAFLWDQMNLEGNKQISGNVQKEAQNE